MDTLDEQINAKIKEIDELETEYNNIIPDDDYATYMAKQGALNTRLYQIKQEIKDIILSSGNPIYKRIFQMKQLGLI